MKLEQAQDIASRLNQFQHVPAKEREALFAVLESGIFSEAQVSISKKELCERCWLQLVWDVHEELAEQ